MAEINLKINKVLVRNQNTHHRLIKEIKKSDKNFKQILCLSSYM